MLKKIKTLFEFLILSGLFVFTGCETEDPGPLQEVEKEFSIVDFDRLEMGSAFNIRVEQGSTYSIEVKGDRRNINDLDVFKNGSTLIIKFDDNSNRTHETYITITMPRLEAVNFSGASISKINGFESDEELDFYLSGASVCQLNAGYREVDLALSGASSLLMYGLGDELNAEISGASVLSAFDFPVREANIDVTGASTGKITVTDELKVVAAGASSLLYRGSPSFTSSVSGASTIEKD